MQVFSLLPALPSFDLTKMSEAVVLFKDSFDAIGADQESFHSQTLANICTMSVFLDFFNRL